MNKRRDRLIDWESKGNCCFQLSVFSKHYGKTNRRRQRTPVQRITELLDKKWHIFFLCWVVSGFSPCTSPCPSPLHIDLLCPCFYRATEHTDPVRFKYDHYSREGTQRTNGDAGGHRNSQHVSKSLSLVPWNEEIMASQWKLLLFPISPSPPHFLSLLHVKPVVGVSLSLMLFLISVKSYGEKGNKMAFIMHHDDPFRPPTFAFDSVALLVVKARLNMNPWGSEGTSSTAYCRLSIKQSGIVIVFSAISSQTNYSLWMVSS